MLWITGFHVRALDSKTKNPISNDFICHTNVDFNDVNYFTNFNLTNLGGKRLSLALKFSLSQRGIIMGWKKGAEVWPHDVHILQLDLMLLVKKRG